uniref:Capsid protein n=2 Tax=Biomphalaria pfeifferi virus TaxID=2884323 RepID=A0A8K1P8D0_9VIRU|nr:MAG: capsid protein precursor [Biomphalaria pfeifferi virus]
MSEFEYIGASVSEANHVYGTFVLTQVLPTPSLANSSLPVFKVYAHWEDLEVIGRVPISGTTFIVPQSGATVKPRGLTPSDRELEENGLFSGVLATAARVPKAIGRVFPSLGPLMGSTSWFLAATARAASAYGFSKPVVQKLSPVVRLHHVYENNIDMPVPALAVGAFAGNSVAVSKALSGTDVDEMSFDYVLTKPSQIFRGSISTTDAHSTVEYASQVALTHMWFRAPTTGSDRGNISFPRGTPATGGFTAVIPSNLLYFAQHFRLWHGDLVYRVTFAKSKFHTGRVMFTFIPNYQRVSNVSTYAEAGLQGGPAPGLFAGDLQPSQYSMVFDLKDGSEFEFEVPFIAPVSHLGINDSMGFVSMQIMDPLIANGESSDTITFIVEVAAKPGFYFAGIGGPNVPIWPDQTAPTIEFQSGVGATATDASQHSVGEKFMSTKQIMMHPIVRRFNHATGTTASGTIPLWPCAPAWGDGNPLPANSRRQTPFMRAGMVAQCYAFGIGSTLLYQNTAALGGSSLMRIVQSPGDNGEAVTGTVPGLYTRPLVSPNTAWAQISRGPNSTESYLLPMLSSSPRFRIGDFNQASITRDWSPSGSSNLTTDSLSVKTTYNWSANNVDGATRPWYWGIAAADDARCSCWIGPCPMVLANNTSTENTWYIDGGVT